MNFRLFIKTICLSSIGIFGSQVFAENVGAPSAQPGNNTAPTAGPKAGIVFPAGTFGGDDILLTLDNRGKYSLSGGAVEKPVHGTWTIERNGRHTLLRLSSRSQDGNWLFGVRSKDTLQAVDEDKLNVLERPLNATEDAGVLTREK